MIFRNSSLAAGALLLGVGALTSCSATPGAAHAGPARTTAPALSPSAAPTPSASMTPAPSPDTSASPSATHRPSATATRRRAVPTTKPDLHTTVPRTPGPGEVSTAPQNGDCRKIPTGMVCGVTKTGVPIPRPS